MLTYFLLLFPAERQGGVITAANFVLFNTYRDSTKGKFSDSFDACESPSVYGSSTG